MFRHPWGISEDDLTGDFFGLMKYLPFDMLLAPFLSLLQSLYPDRNIPTQNAKPAEILLWPEYQIPREWQEQFNRPDIPAERRRSKFYIVPDTVIRVDDCIFVVEAEKSHSVEAEQLFQQYLLGRRIFSAMGDHKCIVFSLLVNTDQIPPYACHINAVDRNSGISISPGDSIPIYIKKRMQMLGEVGDIEEISHSFIWISWHHIGKLAEDILNIYQRKKDQVSIISAGFLLGLREMFDREGFYPVRIFRADDPEEIQVNDYSSIPVLHALPNLEELIKLQDRIDPSLIPTFHFLEDIAAWLSQQYINPELIQVLRKEV